MAKKEVLKIKELAKKDYIKGVKYNELADKYQVCINTIKSWKHRYNWTRKSINTKNEQKTCIPRRGAPLDNKNALGNNGGARMGNKSAEGYGATKDNKNALITGEFEFIFWDTLEKDEMELVGQISYDKRNLLKQEIQLLTVRERRMLKRISTLRNKEMVVDTAIVGVNGKYVIDTVESIAAINRIQNIEESLTRIQDKKAKFISELHKWQMDEEKFKLDKSKVSDYNLNVSDDGFIEALQGKISEVWEEEK